MEWTPFFLFTFKIVVLSIGMFFAIKWHYDQGKKEHGKQMGPRALLRTGGMIVAGFTLSLLALGFVTLMVGRTLGIDLPLP